MNIQQARQLRDRIHKDHPLRKVYIELDAPDHYRVQLFLGSIIFHTEAEYDDYYRTQRAATPQTSEAT